MGVYYYEAPFEKPGDDRDVLVKKYESMGRHNGDGRGSRKGFVHNPPPPDYGKKFIDNPKYPDGCWGMNREKHIWFGPGA